jgi:hypothetical protein
MDEDDRVPEEHGEYAGESLVKATVPDFGTWRFWITLRKFFNNGADA